MDLPARTTATVSIVVLAVAGLVAACGGGPAAAALTAPPVTGAEGSTPGSPSPSGAAAAPAASAAPSSDPGRGGLGPDVLTACLTLAADDCERARGFAATTLEPTDPAVVYVQVGPFGCATGEHCATTLLTRPEGDVTLEFADGTSAAVHLTVAPDGSFEATRDPGFGMSLPPTSPPGLELGRMDFTLGHCGIFSGIDLDGSWWDPVGPISMDDGEAVNPTAGIIAFTDADHATFLAPGGLTVQLVRRDGPKVLPPCM